MHWWWLEHEWETHTSQEDRRLLGAPAATNAFNNSFNRPRSIWSHLVTNVERHFGFQLQLLEKILFYVADKVTLETDGSQKPLLSRKPLD